MYSIKKVIPALVAAAFVTSASTGVALADFNGEEVEQPGWLQISNEQNARALEQQRVIRALNAARGLEDVADFNGEEPEQPGFLRIFQRQNAKALANRPVSSASNLEEVRDWNGEEPELIGGGR